jgi:hypothetical protein
MRRLLVVCLQSTLRVFTNTVAAQPHRSNQERLRNASTFTQHPQAPARRLRRAVSDMDLVNQAWSLPSCLVEREQALYAKLI